MAAPLTGVQWSQPALATAPRSVEPPACAAAGFRATALARVPPNQAARPTSCIEREIVSRAITFLPGGICALRYPRGPRKTRSGTACRGAAPGSGELLHNSAAGASRGGLRGRRLRDTDLLLGRGIADVCHRRRRRPGRQVAGRLTRPAGA